MTENLYEAMFPDDDVPKPEPIEVGETNVLPKEDDIKTQVVVPKERPSWDSYFMELAQTVSTRATCPRRAVGAVIVKDKRVIATGYNGSPPNHPHCTDEGCLLVDDHCVRVIHAEANAVLQGAKYGVEMIDSTCYCTTLPCLPCTKLLIGAGVRHVLYASDYRPDQLLEQFQIEMRFFSG